MLKICFRRAASSGCGLAVLVMLMTGAAGAQTAPHHQLAHVVKPASAVSQTTTKNDPWAVFMQARRYAAGDGVKRSSVKARDLYLEALKSGQPKVRGAAAYALGELHLRKPLYAPREAARYFALGSAAQDPWSAYKLAELREKGLGVPRSATKARQLYLSIAGHGDVKVQRAAYLALGRLHTKRPLRNIARAERYFRQGLRRGDMWSAYFLVDLYQPFAPTKANRIESRRLIRVLSASKDRKVRKAARDLVRRHKI